MLKHIKYNASMRIECRNLSEGPSAKQRGLLLETHPTEIGKVWINTINLPDKKKGRHVTACPSTVLKDNV